MTGHVYRSFASGFLKYLQEQKRCSDFVPSPSINVSSLKQRLQSFVHKAVLVCQCSSNMLNVKKKCAKCFILHFSLSFIVHSARNSYIAYSSVHCIQMDFTKVTVWETQLHASCFYIHFHICSSFYKCKPLEKLGSKQWLPLSFTGRRHKNLQYFGLWNMCCKMTNRTFSASRYAKQLNAEQFPYIVKRPSKSFY